MNPICELLTDQRTVQRLVIGVPSYNEVSTICEITKLLDTRVTELPTELDAVLVNSDNCSPDGTSIAFASTATRTPKVALTTSPGHRGKGYNFLKLFDFAQSWGADALICLDADLEAIPSDWLPAYLDAISAGHDLVVPLYPRHWYDGNLTNQVVVPLVALTGHAIRQPIGGDFGFSARALSSFTRMHWPPEAHGFGVDIFLVMRALLTNLSVVQQPLSTGKLHSWRSDTAAEVLHEMSSKFFEVVGTLLKELDAFSLRQGISNFDFPNAPPISAPSKTYDPAHIVETANQVWTMRRKLVASSGLLERTHSMLPPELNDRVWAKTLATLKNCWKEANQVRLLEAFEALFYARLATVLPVLRYRDIELLVEQLSRSVSAHCHTTQ